MKSTLLPNRHLQTDFFMCDVFDSFKDDFASMEHPIFSLSKKPDYRMLVYERNGVKIKIKPSYTGLATIFDKDILLYLASSLMNAKNLGEPTSQTVRFTSYNYFISTNKSTGGCQYKRIKEALERLNGTVIQTNIKTKSTEITKEFGLIDSWGVIKEDDKGKAIAIEVKLSDWFYNSILGNEVLTIDKEYFRLRKPTERRLYELARKHCGNQSAWKIKIETLRDKLGTVTPLRKLKFNIKSLSKTNHLPEYHVSLENDVVIFSRKESPKEHKIPKYVTKKQIEKHAKPGESTQQVIDRLKSLKNALKTS